MTSFRAFSSACDVINCRLLAAIKTVGAPTAINPSPITSTYAALTCRLAFLTRVAFGGGSRPTRLLIPTGVQCKLGVAAIDSQRKRSSCVLVATFDGKRWRRNYPNWTGIDSVDPHWTLYEDLPDRAEFARCRLSTRLRERCRLS